jgi:crotonobetainyl-CoA:carnitine CoA-transferase CaiB-like acyl-CoA transferase
VLLPHALIGWWRYSGLSKLTGALAVVSTVLAIYCSITGFGQRHPLAIVLGVAFAVLAVAVLVPAAVRAERARRHGCW